MGDVKKCVVLTEDQNSKIMAIAVRRMTQEKRTVSYSEVLRSALDEGLKVL